MEYCFQCTEYPCARYTRACLLYTSIQPTVSGFSGAAHSRDFAVADEALAYLAPAKLMAATVIDLLAGGAAKRCV